MRNRKLRRAVGVILSAVLFVVTLAGCSGKGETQTDSPNGEEGLKESNRTQESGERVMGRFLEADVEFPAPIGKVYDMKKQSDGSIRIIISNADNGHMEVWDSKDVGANWEKAYDFPDELQNEDVGYVDEAVLSAEGQAVCVFSNTEGDGVKPMLYLLSKEGNASKVDFELPERTQNDKQSTVSSSFEVNEDDLKDDQNEPSEEDESSADGELEDAKSSEAEESEDDFTVGNLITEIQFVGNDQVLVSDLTDNIYQVNLSDGSVKYTYEFGDGEQAVQTPYIVGNKMITVGGGGVSIYDTQTGEAQASDEALQNNVFKNGMIHAVDTTDGGESFYYLDGGLYHYKFGGSIMEQLIDGEMSSLGAPAFYPIALTMMDDQNLLVAANDPYAVSGLGISLLKYTYSADTPAKPEKELKVYSLYENKEIGQAINSFQKKNTDVYVNYQVGLTEENAMTVSDALKTLTTEIMAGKGPDVLVLDGMPVETYIEKGILLDLSSMIAEDEDNYFSHILGTYKTEKGLCAIPARFMIPMAQGGSAYYNPGEDFDTFTARKDLLKNMDPKSVVEKFWYSCGAAWKKEDGALDQAKITDFLIKLKNAFGEYDSSTEDVGTKVFGSTITGGPETVDERRQETLGWGELELAGGILNVNIGLCNKMDYGMIEAILKRVENGNFGLMPGQAENVFVPTMIMGISSKSTQTEAAQQFIKYLFGKDAQIISQSGGFPVQREAFLSVIDGNQYEGQEDLSMAFSGAGMAEGDYISYMAKPTPQEEIDKFTELVESLTTPALQDDVIKETVIEQGTKVLKGEQTPEEAVNEIMQKVKIYIAE